MSDGPEIIIAPGNVLRSRSLMLGFVRRAVVRKIASATTRSSLGMPAPTATGTLTGVYNTTGEYIDHATAASNNGGWTSNANMQPVTQPIFSAIIQMNGVTNARWWIGLSVGDPRASDDPSTHLAAFRFTAGTDTYWMACVKDGTTLNAQSTGIAPAGSTRYELVVDLSEYNSGAIHFYIDGVRKYTHTSNLPGSTQQLDPYCSIRDTSGAGGPSLRISAYQALV